MKHTSQTPENQVQFVSNFQDLVSTPFEGRFNAMCWKRELFGDFSEIIHALSVLDNITELNHTDLNKLQLSENGKLARDILINDWNLLSAYGASPVLNVIQSYESDTSFFSTDVYSYHVDRSPVPTDTFLSTYHGMPSDILPNAQAEQKIYIPEIREKLKELYDGEEEGFGTFLSEYYYDLHYAPKANAMPISLGQGNLWKIAVDHPESTVPPCLHRAPREIDGQKRLLLIC